MINRKAIITLAVLMCLVVSGVSAGDTASFVDLGFSPDGRTYVFAQYGVQSRTLKPWADLFVVDVAQNNFVSGGRISYLHDSPVVAGQDGSGALYRVIAQNASMTERFRVNYCFQGQPLYVTIDTNALYDTLPSGQTPIEFRDFGTGSSYKASLVSYVEGSGETLKSSFFITLDRTGPDGAKKTYTIGTPQLKRSLVASYRIKKVMIAPHDGSMIFVIEMIRQEEGDVNIRYMVEALRL